MFVHSFCFLFCPPEAFGRNFFPLKKQRLSLFHKDFGTQFAYYIIESVAKKSPTLFLILSESHRNFSLFYFYILLQLFPLITIYTMRSNNFFNQIITMLFRSKIKEGVKQHVGVPEYPFFKIRKR